MALEELRQKEEELKQIMIYVGRPGLWADWQRFQAQARKAQKRARKISSKRREEIMTVVQWVRRSIISIYRICSLVYF